MEILKILRYTLFFLLLSGPEILGAQTAFVKVYSGNGYDKGEGACQLSDSSFLITGSSSSFADAPSQAFILHIDSAGNYLWSKAYGGIESETGKRIMAVEGYGYYVAGTSSSSGSGDFDNYLFFTDESGNQQWQTFTDNGGWERVNDAALLASDTSVITVGQTDQGTDFVDDIYICRYTKTGQLMWDVRFGTAAGSDVANAVQLITDTSFVVAGSYFVEDSLQNKAFLALYHINGTQIWQKTFGNNGRYWLNDIDLASGVINAVGESLPPDSEDDYDRYTLKCDYNGNALYETDYKVEHSIRAVALTNYSASTNGKFFVAEETINMTFPTFVDGEDVFIHRFLAQLDWDGYGYSYSGIGQDQINQLIPASDGFALGVGFNTAYGGGGNGVLLVKIGNENVFPVFTTDPDITNIVHVSENDPVQNLLVYPNPVSDQLNIKLDEKPFDYVLSDLSGRKITEGKSFGAGSLDLSDQPQGTYLLKVSSEGKETVLKIIR